MRTDGQIFINGEFVTPVKGQTFEVVNPYDEGILTNVGAATAEDIDLAVNAASTAFEQVWGKTTGHERANYLRAMGTKVQEEIQELSRLETLDCGKPLPESVWDMEDVVSCFNYYAKLAEKLDDEEKQSVELPDADFSAYLRYEPMGVAGAIVPWNYPLLMALWKVAPALAAGCTVILKPSEITPLSALELARIAQEVNLPPGVLNVVTGTGLEAGAPLVAHPKVQKIAFTGGVPHGSVVMQECAKQIKNVSLELGGKSPAIVFKSCNIKRTVEWVMFGCFWTNGQICSSTSRLLIEESIYDEFVELLIAETKKICVGNPLDAKTKLGPVVSKMQQEKVLRYIGYAEEEGATIHSANDKFEKGYFVNPTIVTDVKPTMRVWKEEIFGPVLSVMKFKTEEEAIGMANDSEFGLAGAVFTQDSDQMERITKALRAGIVWNNCSQPCFCEVPWGGFKKSGVGRELGPFGLYAYLEPKQVTTYLPDKDFGWYYGQ